MKDIPVRIRDMRAELAAKGIQSDTTEVRYTFQHGTYSSNLTPSDRGTETKPHFHLFTQEHFKVLDGAVDACVYEGTAPTRNELKLTASKRYAASGGALQSFMFERGEVHGVLFPNDAPLCTYTLTTPKTAALTLCDKIIPPSLDVRDDEVPFVIGSDFFEFSADPKLVPKIAVEDYKPTEAEWKSMAFKDKKTVEQFWKIVERNVDRMPSWAF